MQPERTRTPSERTVVLRMLVFASLCVTAAVALILIATSPATF